MPIIYNISSPKGERVGVWEITEDEDTLIHSLQLTESEKEILSTFKNKTRRLQWLAVRNLLKNFHPVRPLIDYETSGKPFLVNHEAHVSISHSGNYAAIILNENEVTGIDIEEINPRIMKVGERFTGEFEKNYLKQLADSRQPSANSYILALTLIWGAKEVLFKMLHRDNISFKNNFQVESFVLSDKGILNTKILMNNTRSCISLEYRRINNYILVYPSFK